MTDTAYDVVVVGAGPGGYVAAIRAAQLGLRTAVVERQYLGGVCLNVGCIPTKAMLHSAELVDEAHEAKRFGVVIKDVSVDWEGVLRNKDAVVKQMTGGVGFLMKKNKIDVHMGAARLIDRGRVQVTGADGKATELAAKNVVIATGARPRELPQIGAVFDGERIINSYQALSLTALPTSILIVGASAIGCEFASMFRSFGAEVTLIEALPRIVPAEDEEVSAELTRQFQRRGIKLMPGAKLTALKAEGDEVTAQVTDADGKEHTLKAERALLGIGIAPNTQELGLAERGVELDQRGFVKVDQLQRTTAEGVYAIGDCALTTPWLAHKASAEGILAAEAIAGHHPRPLAYHTIPACTYCSPEIASVGLTEARAREQGYDVKTGKFPFSANGKATILGQRVGFIKIVAEKKYDEVLGVHMIGPRVTELIAEGGLALSHEATAESLMRTVHAHPTLYEAIGEAAHAAAEGAAIHI
ncbi:MAG TPA: dihydrolipoyl dehydrogenase [Roseiflexaceae bacterium]|nr:dihydrolipoyl dehydrogenase [Roseiflexaceae bacterium]